jgi:NHL repeat
VAGSGNKGFADGAPLQAQFDAQAGIAIDGAGKIYVADRNNFRIRLIAAQVTTLAGTGVQGQLDGPRLSTAKFSRPLGVALDKPSAPTVVYVADAEGKTIRKVELK